MVLTQTGGGEMSKQWDKLIGEKHVLDVPYLEEKLELILVTQRALVDKLGDKHQTCC